MVSHRSPEGAAGHLSHSQHLRPLLRSRDFTRLFATRLTSQCADGIFQASLAGAVLFNPERHTDPTQVAAGFAVLLLPYSLVGPFAGVLLDRWSRQRVLFVANLVRCLLVALAAGTVAAGMTGPLFYGTALATISVNRFFLAGLSAALPHVVTDDQLVTANAVSTTLGAIATVTGGGIALLVRAVTGTGNHGYAAVALFSAVFYAASALTARRFPRDRLGPDAHEIADRETLRDVWDGLVLGAKHIAARRPAKYALAAIAAHRFFYGISTIATLLLYRNYFHDDGVLRVGLAGLAQLIAVGAIGSLVAAFVTPAATRRMGKPAWITVLLGVAGLVQVSLGTPYSLPALIPAAFFLGMVAQGIKISVDTTVQESIDDEFRGRVFSVYDTLFNVTFVAAAAVAAMTLPLTGKSYPMIAVVTAGYLLTAAAYAAATAHRGRLVLRAAS
ncbi:MAG TPA: MFS transporter [Mycobacteriales bacterium]|jgi:MFS family permease